MSLNVTASRVLTACLCIAISACSTVILSAATTPAEELLPAGATRDVVRAKFGEAISSEPVPAGYGIAHIRTHEKRSHILMRQIEVNTERGFKREWPLVEWSTREVYRYNGAIRGAHDAGESTSLALMTAGVSELVTAPHAAAASRTRTWLVTVWYDREGVAVGFNWKEAPLLNQ